MKLFPILFFILSLISTTVWSAPSPPLLQVQMPLTYTSGVLAIPKADSTHNGYLSSADWNTFSNAASPQWGTITGLLSNQTDLQNALNLKAPLANPQFTGLIAVDTTTPTDSQILLGGTPAAAVVRGVNVTTTFSPVSTSFAAYRAAPTLAAGATATAYTAYNGGALSLGSGASVARVIDFFTNSETVGSTANVGFADSGANTITGNWFIYNGGNRPSFFTGNVSLIGGITTGLTASSVIVTDGSSNLAASSVSSTTLGFLDATSSVQTQLNSKQATGNYATSGSGDVAWSAPSGAGPVTTTVSNASVIAKVLTGFSAGAGTISATDSILSGFNKIAGNDALKAPIASPTFTGTVTVPLGAGVVQSSSGGVLSAGTVSLTSQVTGLLPVANGGTGLGTLTSGSVIIGAGTSTPTFVAPGTSGNVLTSSGGAWVSSAAASSGVTTVGAFSGSSQANGASISTSTITFGPADATNPGMVAASGAQTFGNTPTFNNVITAGGANALNFTSTNALFGRIVTALDTGTITWQANINTTNETHGGPSIVMTANDGTASNSGSIIYNAYGTGGATSDIHQFNVRSSAGVSSEVLRIVNGGLLLAGGKALNLQGAGAIIGGTGATTLGGTFMNSNHGLYAGNSATSIDTRAFSRLGFGFHGDLAGATQYGLWSDPAPTSAATTQYSSLYSYVNGTAGTITFAEMNGLFLDQPNLVANNTATRMNGIRIVNPAVPFAGTVTNSASITDNVSYTGAYTLNFSSTNPSFHGGNFTIGLTKTLSVQGGTNGCHGQATLASGTATVSTSCAPSSSQDIFLTDGGGTVTNIGSHSVGTVTGGTSFVINSSNVLDASNINWLVVGH